MIYTKNRKYLVIVFNMHLELYFKKINKLNNKNSLLGLKKKIAKFKTAVKTPKNPLIEK